MKFPINERVLVKTTSEHDFYIMKTAKIWYVEMFPVGTLDHSKKTVGGLCTLKSAKHTIEMWAQDE